MPIHKRLKGYLNPDTAEASVQINKIEALSASSTASYVNYTLEKPNFAIRMPTDYNADTKDNYEYSEEPPRCYIDPEGIFKKIWETFKFVLLIYCFITVPLKFAFAEISDNQKFYLVDKIVDILFFIDMAVSFLTPIYVNHELVYSKKVIAKHYLKSWFATDLLSVIPFEEIMKITQPENENLQTLA